MAINILPADDEDIFDDNHITKRKNTNGKSKKVSRKHKGKKISKNRNHKKNNLFIESNNSSEVSSEYSPSEDCESEYTSSEELLSSSYYSGSSSKNESSSERVSGVQRFISNFSFSMINFLNILLLDLEENLKEFSSDNQTIDIEKLLLFKIPENKHEKERIILQKNALIKRMKVELNVVFKQIFKSKSMKLTSKTVDLLIKKIRKSLICEGIKDELIHYLKSNEQLLSRNDLMRTIGKIVKNRLKHNRNFSVEFSHSENDGLSSSESYSLNYSSEDGKSSSFNKKKHKNSDLEKFKYQITHLNTFKFKKNELNKEASFKDPDVIEKKNYPSDWAFEENEDDIQNELNSMKWCNSEKIFKYLFTSPVNYQCINEAMLEKYKENNKTPINTEIDIGNFEAILLKKRFLDLHEMKKFHQNEEKYQIVIDNNENLDLKEIKELEKNNIKKYIKKTRYFKDYDNNHIECKKKLSFSNISRPNNLPRISVPDKKTSFNQIDEYIPNGIDPEKVY